MGEGMTHSTSPVRSKHVSSLRDIDDNPDASGYKGVYDKFESCWCNIRLAMNDIIQICEPLESHALKSESKYKLFNNVMEHFKKDRVKREDVYNVLRIAVLEQIRMYRLKEDIIFCQLYNIIEMLTFIELYDTIEVDILNETRRYYRQLASEHLSQRSCPECYKIFQSLIEFEKSACKYYLNDVRTNRVMDVVLEELLYTHPSKLMDHNILKDLIVLRDLESILLLKSLYSQSKYNELLPNSIMNSAKDVFNDIILSFVKDKQETVEDEYYNRFIDKLYEYQKVMDELIMPVMANKYEYMSRIKIMWVSLLNNDDERVEFITIALAKYSNYMSIHLNTDEFTGGDHSKLDFILHLFRFIENKSYFELCYRNFLGMRLLYDQDINNNHISTIIRLKEECGVNYVSKLEHIVLDVRVSEELKNEFIDNHLPNVEPDGVGMKILSDYIKYNVSYLIVSSDTWICKRTFERPLIPVNILANDDEFIEIDTRDDANSLSKIAGLNESQENDSVIDDINSIQMNFRNFYTNKYKNKLITFLPEFGSVTITKKFNSHFGGRYEFKFSICQAYCILLFNKKERVNLRDLEDVLSLDYNEMVMRKHLNILNRLTPTPLILFNNQHINFETCTKFDYFLLNEDFHSENSFVDCRCKCHDLFSKDDLSFVNKRRTFEDMVPFIESTIVRYLKQTIEASSTTLFKMCCKNSHYTISREQFNKVIDSLISREFIQFNANNKEFLQYIP